METLDQERDFQRVLCKNMLELVFNCLLFHFGNFAHCCEADMKIPVQHVIKVTQMCGEMLKHMYGLKMRSVTELENLTADMKCKSL